ncbi:hypothetical protein IV203_025312 [Nitzschia inconspicua]|uniref:Uncharacterized protein n=1 Tax=Nitzschia inconspicua TaxID=303405 RepID=A0A9K3P9P6_9STRA|nr:hypothetical protein IV203_024682 [Nitzschia inconspicua]KAG7362428.1 hypothetical protein IV203_025312 [Nitzschia inconspicua]
MPPQATGFRYTPPSYLLRTSQEQEQQQSQERDVAAVVSPPVKEDTTNRPWNISEEEDEAAMRQEDRPTRITTQMDAHFRQRLQKKQNRYRNILKGEEDIPDDAATRSSFEDAIAHDVEAIAVLQEQQKVKQAAQATEQARECRKQRISGVEKPPTTSPNDTTLEVARSLRAQRLRTSLLQRTPEEVDVQTKLEQRRKTQQELDKIAQQQEIEREQLQQSRLVQERLQLQRDREELEQAKREATFRLANQWRQAHHASDLDSLDDVLQDKSSTFKRESNKKTSKKKRRSRRSKSVGSVNLEEPDFAFLEEWSSLLRESGIIAGCVGQCFGHQDDVPDENSTSTGNPSLPELSGKELQQAERLNVYAKYRE